VNECGACGQDFGSLELFDRHRRGVHEYTFQQGMESGREDGRRCLDISEMEAPARAARARTAFGRAQVAA
jgi:hypothetical protein